MEKGKELRELYQEIIMDHQQNPKNFCELFNATHRAEGYNPLCGDKVTVFLILKDDIIEKITFQGNGCAISIASASLMTDVLTGRTTAEAKHIFEEFHNLVTNQGYNKETVKRLRAFSGVGKFPMRVKCATLAWHTMCDAMCKAMCKAIRKENKR